MTTEHTSLYTAVKQADDAWHDALVAAYGPDKAIEARYDMLNRNGSGLGAATADLRRLYFTYRHAADAFFAHARR